MKPKQKLFADEYLIDRNATQAAIRSGYSQKTATQIGSKLLTFIEVSKYIAEKSQSIAEKLGITHEYVLGSVKTLADTTAPIGEWHNPQAAIKAYDMLGKHLKLWDDGDKNKQATNVTIQITQF